MYTHTAAASHAGAPAVRPAFNVCSGTRDHSRVPVMRTPLEEISGAESSSRMSANGRHVAPGLITNLSGPRCWHWMRPWTRNHSHWDSGSDATKYSATSRCGKGIVSRIDGQGPNVATRRNETAALVIPSVAVVRRPESSACCA
jgi:hypothetical protein